MTAMNTSITQERDQSQGSQGREGREADTLRVVKPRAARVATITQRVGNMVDPAKLEKDRVAAAVAVVDLGGGLTDINR